VAANFLLHKVILRPELSEGVRSVRFMERAYDLDPVSLSPDERVEALVASEHELARIQARQVRLLEAMAAESFAGAVASELDREWVKEEIRAALGVSAVWVSSQLAFAQALVHRLPATLDAMEAGLITFRHARSLYEALIGVDDVDATKIEATVLPFAAGRDLVAFRRKVRREVLRLDARTVEERLAAALADRHVWQFASDRADGMGTVSALLPAPHLVQVMSALDFRAHSYGDDDPRTMDQRRADALHELVLAGLAALSGAPGACGHCEQAAGGGVPVGPSVQVTVALSTLLGIDNEPGELAGYGPIPAPLARRIAADENGTWRRLVTDEVGRLVDYGRTRYRPPTDLREFVVARDRTCMFPTCNRAACACEIDHATAWADGGPTCADNLTALCSRHHHGKHEADWNLERLADGSIQWTSPPGHTYVVPAATYPIDTTSREPDTLRDGEHPATETDADPPAAA
jgi:hypothetical protein